VGVDYNRGLVTVRNPPPPSPADDVVTTTITQVFAIFLLMLKLEAGFKIQPVPQIRALAFPLQFTVQFLSAIKYKTIQYNRTYM
jgi:hypothetical protein